MFQLFRFLSLLPVSKLHRVTALTALESVFAQYVFDRELTEEETASFSVRSILLPLFAGVLAQVRRRGSGGRP